MPALLQARGDQDPPAEPPNAGDESARCGSSCMVTPGMNPGFRSTVGNKSAGGSGSPRGTPQRWRRERQVR